MNSARTHVHHILDKKFAEIQIFKNLFNVKTYRCTPSKNRTMLQHQPTYCEVKTVTLAQHLI